MDQKVAKDVGKSVKKGLFTVLKAFGIAAVITIGATIAGGIIAASAAPAGAATLVMLGGIGIGFVGGGYVGSFAAKSYLKSKAAPAILAAGKLVDELNKELEAKGEPSLGKQLGVEKELGQLFGKEAEKQTAAPANDDKAAAPVVEAKAEEKPKAPSAPTP